MKEAFVKGMSDGGCGLKQYHHERNQSLPLFPLNLMRQVWFQV